MAEAIETAVRLADEAGAGAGVLIAGSVYAAGEARALLVHRADELMRLDPTNPMGRVMLSILAFEAIMFGLAIAGMIQVSSIGVLGRPSARPGRGGARGGFGRGPAAGRSATRSAGSPRSWPSPSASRPR